MSGVTTSRIRVRSYEIDVNGHVNHAIYHRYGEHGRTEHLAAAGIGVAELADHGLGVVLLETHVRFLRELRHRDEVDVITTIVFGDGKTFEFRHELRRVADDELAAEITARMGLLDVRSRRLVPDPHGHLATIATHLDPL